MELLKLRLKHVTGRVAQYAGFGLVLVALLRLAESALAFDAPVFGTRLLRTSAYNSANLENIALLAVGLLVVWLSTRQRSATV